MDDYGIGQALTALAIGMDRLERELTRGEGALDREGLVPIYLGQNLVAPLDLHSWSEAHIEIDRLEKIASAYPEGPRRSFLLSMLDSLRTAAQLFAGETLSFADKLEHLVGVPATATPTETVEDIQQTLDRLLERAGYRIGSLAQRVERWEAAHFLAADELAKVLDELMVEAKRRTDEMIYPTGDYQMHLHPVKDVPYTARCNFTEGKMDLNLDLKFTRSSLKHLIAHEIFPGHSTQLLYTLDRARSGQSSPDVLLCTTNGATGAIQEGIGDQGIHLIDWVEDSDDALYMTLRRLRSAVATSGAWYLMAERWPQEQVHDYLRDYAFAQPAWIMGRLRLAAHPFRGPFIASYWFGDEAVREVRERVLPAQRKAFIEYLYGRMNTPTSLRMFSA
jgi:hypothetical protein